MGRELAYLGARPRRRRHGVPRHDLGHPPFGHNGERALNDWAEDIGGFEGNAQTLRILTRLEPKVFDDDGRSFGLNLTRASLDATCKYPWPQSQPLPDPADGKFGVYDDDEPVVRWLRAGAPERVRCIEAEVMDLSDDIAYSVHDFEDAIVNGYLDVPALSARADHDALVDSMFEWVGGEFDHDGLIAAFDRLDSLAYWIDTWDGSRRDLARLKNLTSQLIGRFAGESVRGDARGVPAEQGALRARTSWCRRDAGRDRGAQGHRRRQRDVHQRTQADLRAPARHPDRAGGRPVVAAGAARHRVRRGLGRRARRRRPQARRGRPGRVADRRVGARLGGAPQPLIGGLMPAGPARSPRRSRAGPAAAFR